MFYITAAFPRKSACLVPSFKQRMNNSRGKICFFTLMRHPVLLETVKRGKRGGAIQFVRLYPVRAGAVSQVGGGEGGATDRNFSSRRHTSSQAVEEEAGTGKICNILHGHICLGKRENNFLAKCEETHFMCRKIFHCFMEIVLDIARPLFKPGKIQLHEAANRPHAVSMTLLCLVMKIYDSGGGGPSPLYFSLRKHYGTPISA